MSSKGCDHLQQYKKTTDILDTIRWIHLAFIAGSNSKCRKIKITNSYCRTCKKRGPLLHACLECVYFGCHMHIRSHMEEQKHVFSMDLNYGQIHCNLCQDYVYDSEVDKALLDTSMNVRKFKKRLFSWTTWDPTKDERELIPKTKKICIGTQPYLGLRGLYNLGDTCYLNCAIQMLINLPLLRDYFLTETHTCNLKLGTCFVCMLSNLFQKFYGNSLGEPLALVEMLQLTYTYQSQLAHGQQDPHEFLTFLLEQLHIQLTTTVGKDSESNDKCSCIVDKLFRFDLQSDIVCQKCRNVSTTYDTGRDLQLDLINKGELEDCLTRFTRLEVLTDLILCTQCNMQQKSTKQIKIKTLPVVACFQLKRYKNIAKVSSKISSFIRFPEVLDLTPYTCQSKRDSPFPTDNRYYLVSILTHNGELKGGHHYAYVRQHPDKWFKISDDIIIRTQLSEVLEAEAYLLFYQQKVLEFN